jgi:hypothetical protein
LLQEVRSGQGVMVPAATVKCAKPLVLAESEELAARRHEGSEMVKRLLSPFWREAVALVEGSGQGA